jgi:hypothetical protein
MLLGKAGRRMQMRRGENRERVVFPRPQRVEGREVYVRVLARNSAPADTRDVDSDDVVANLGYPGATYAGFEYAQYAD